MGSSVPETLPPSAVLAEYSISYTPCEVDKELDDEEDDDDRRLEDDDEEDDEDESDFEDADDPDSEEDDASICASSGFGVSTLPSVEIKFMRLSMLADVKVSSWSSPSTESPLTLSSLTLKR